MADRKGNALYGTLNEESLMILLSLTKIKSSKNIDAIRDCMVNGMSQVESCKKNSIDKTILSRKLSSINDIHSKILQFMESSKV